MEGGIHCLWGTFLVQQASVNVKKIICHINDVSFSFNLNSFWEQCI